MKKDIITKIVPPVMCMSEEEVKQWNLCHAKTSPSKAWIRFEDGYNWCRLETIKRLKRLNLKTLTK